MGDLQMHPYSKLSDSGNDSNTSENSNEIKQSDCGVESESSTEIPPTISQLLEEHGYTIKREFTQGVSGRVFLMTDTHGDLYVIKQINSKYKEVEILKCLKHGYIVTYVDFFEDEANGHIYIVMEYCEGGNLFQRMKTQRENGFFEEQQIIVWLVQICLALQHLHNEKYRVLHRDIKPQNIFLTEDGYINLGDFGSSKVLERADAYAESVVGTELYVSPETLERKYSFKSDIWSFGWLLHDLCMLDVWSNVIERRFQHANSMRGNTPQISERYSEDLQKLIGQMISCDPKDRPSADEILEKPFLKDAVKQNQTIPEILLQKFMLSFKSFDEAYNKHFEDFEALVNDWGETTDSIETINYNTTAGALSGSVIGAAGGITAVVGAILAPFTFGASLIVTGVGLGVGAAGGVAGAASTITNAVIQKSYREKLEKINQSFKKVSEPILTTLNTLRRELKKITKFSKFGSDLTFGNVQASCNVDYKTVVCATQLMNLGLLANVSRFAAQTAKAGRVAAAAVSGVISGLLVLVDVGFIVKDSKEIHQMRQQWKTDDPEKVTSGSLKSIAQMRKTHTQLCEVLKGIKEIRECAVKINECMVRVKETSNLN